MREEREGEEEGGRGRRGRGRMEEDKEEGGEGQGELHEGRHITHSVPRNKEHRKTRYHLQLFLQCLHTRHVLQQM